MSTRSSRKLRNLIAQRNRLSVYVARVERNIESGSDRWSRDDLSYFRIRLARMTIDIEDATLTPAEIKCGHVLPMSQCYREA